MRVLEGFLESILSSPELRNSSYFCDFLELGDDAKFKTKKKAIEKPPTLNKLGDYVNMQGELKIEISKEN